MVYFLQVLSTRLGRKPEDIVKLDANENPYGPPPEARLKCLKCFHEFDSLLHKPIIHCCDGIVFRLCMVLLTH